MSGFRIYSVKQRDSRASTLASVLLQTGHQTGQRQAIRFPLICLAMIVIQSVSLNEQHRDSGGWWPFATSLKADDKSQPDSIQFNRDIRPILSDACFSCHGPDGSRRQSALRLDSRESALSPAESGNSAIVPGDPQKSTLLERIESSDTDLVMPPPSTGKTLSALQKERLKRWIAEGAAYEQHWAFAPLKSITPPAQDAPADASAAEGNEIDWFVRQKLQSESMTLSANADKLTLIRRVTLDLTGLPPEPAEVDAFLADTAPDAWEKVVDRLLQSPHYGERMAVDWLDAARFADTNGYQVDRDRDVYAWRDWVIQAFNSNMRFDQFTVEQIAGDLIPDATLAQKIATGFHRNHMMNEEGGVIPEEFLAEYTADRVETTAAVWLGQTFNCARCHDHKYDPFTQQDFYSLKAFFHSVPEPGRGYYEKSFRESNPPFLKLPSPEQQAQQTSFQTQLDSATAQLAETATGADAEDRRKELNTRIADLKKQLDQLQSEIPTALVMSQLETPRPTFVLMRGAYDRPGAEVGPATPAVLPPMNPDLPKDRMGLAKWLVDPANPLTARVTVNRFWQMLFGAGIVRTSEDFGSQGDSPSHPELLDWLAGEFVRSGWDIRHMLRLMVTSQTYRQTSHVPLSQRERDPENRLLGRGPRFRLSAETIRDQALAASGLLVRKMGGPSVRPYHPAGLYEQITAGSGTNVYVQGKGEDLHRRSLYTYWKRSVPHPAMLLFDAPFREACSLRRPRTNTPLQALNLLNDPTYVEAARFLAERMMKEGGAETDGRIQYGFRLLLTRMPNAAEQRVLRAAFERSLSDFRADADSAKALLSIGDQPADSSFDAAELAAMSVVASTLLNLDETVMKE